MPRIHTLPPLVVSKIAAGEVIERPASVVKELLENSLDAGARRIDIDIEQGGVEKILIVDDGCGIEPDDLPLAVASHATSKLRNADDLFHIHTMGFRGEALNSIAGVAQVQIQSRPTEQATGAQITCNGGDLGQVRPWNGAAGTRIEVRHLFFNTPVRRKFLKSPSTEIGHICETVTRIALAHAGGPGQVGLHLTLRHNGKLVYEIPGSASLLDRIRLFFGPKIYEKLYDIDVRQGTARLHGYISDPENDSGTMKMQYLFLNGRWIRDRSLSHAVQEAYRGLLMTGRYAVTFLFLDLAPDEVDVNVHPTKSEVRFRDSQALHHLVHAALRQRLRAENLTPRMAVPGSTMEPTRPYGSTGLPHLPEPPAPEPWALSAQGASTALLPFSAPPQARVIQPAPVPIAPERNPEVPGPLTSEVTAEPPMAPAETFPVRTPKVIQLYDTYLVVETDAGMLVIDQHALHERILFEHFKQRIRTGQVETQRLLIPEPIELTAEQASRALEHREALAELGLGVEDFGGNTILLTSYPAFLSRRSPQAILRGVVDHLVNRDRPPSREVLFNDLLSLMACHTAVRAGDHLTDEEIQALISQRDLVDDTHHCPHGRPTALLFSRQDLERQFRRV